MAKTLDIKKLVGTISMSDLEQRTSQSLMGKYAGGLFKYYRDHLVDIPTLESYLQLCPGLEDELDNLYAGHMALEKDIESVDPKIKVFQGALFDGLCFIYDSEKNANIGLYTANFSILNHLDVDADVASLVVKKNKEGELKGLRIDTEYNNSTDSFSYKATNARVNLDCHKDNEDPTKRYYMIPYVCILQHMKMMEQFLTMGRTVYVSQEIADGGLKERVISYNKSLLSKYCDNPAAVEDALEPKMFPLSGHFYAPVVGAPSTSSMLTRIDPIKLVEIHGATDKDIKKLGIKKPENPIKDMITTSLIINGLMFVKEEDEGQFVNYLRALPRNELLGDDLVQVSDSNLASYLHSLTKEEMDKVCVIVPVTKKVDSIVKGIGNPRRATKEEIENLRDIVDEHVVKVTIQKSDCTMGSVFGTNNTAILSKLYGKRYFKKYESMAFRFGVFTKFCRGPKSIVKGLKRAGFKSDEETVARLTELMERHGAKSEEFYETAKAYILEGEGVSIKRSEASSTSKAKSNPRMVMVRSMDAYLSPEGKPVNFIKNINIDNIVSCTIFE